MADHEATVRSFLDCLVAQDLGRALDHYAEGASFQVAAWHEPLVGREAISGATEASVALSDYRYTIANIASAGEVVFVEVIDEFRFRERDVTMHWVGVWEIDDAGKITARRDYWDSAELQAQLL